MMERKYIISIGLNETNIEVSAVDLYTVNQQKQDVVLLKWMFMMARAHLNMLVNPQI